MSVVADRGRGGVVTPPRDLAQRMSALETANEVRFARAQLKRDVKARRKPPSVFLEPRPELETMKVMDALLAMPKIGRVKASKTLNRVRISPSKTLGGLSDRQRRELAALLPRMR